MSATESRVQFHDVATILIRRIFLNRVVHND